MNHYAKNNLKSDGNRLGRNKIVDIIKKEFLSKKINSKS